MPELILRYVQGTRGPVLLLSETEEARLVGQTEALRALIDDYHELQLLEDEAGLRAQLYAVRLEIASNEKLKASPDLQTLTVTFNEPTIDDRDAVFAAFDATPAGLQKMKKLAVARLKPTADGEPITTLRFWPAIEDACYASIDYNLSEERRFFSMARSVA